MVNIFKKIWHDSFIRHKALKQNRIHIQLFISYLRYREHYPLQRPQGGIKEYPAMPNPSMQLPVDGLQKQKNNKIVEKVVKISFILFKCVLIH